MIERFTKDLYVEFYETEVLGDKKNTTFKKRLFQRSWAAPKGVKWRRERERERVKGGENDQIFIRF